MRVAIVGAGAAGCFCAVNLKRMAPACRVDVYEAGTRPLAKVAVTGGGRCNITNSWKDVKSLAQVYPRGARLMKRLFHQFCHTDTMRWWQDEGVKLVTQPDGCVFPASQDAMQVVNTLVFQMRQLGVAVHTACRVSRVEADKAGGYNLALKGGDLSPVSADVVVVTAGGQPRESGFDMLSPLGVAIEKPVPSLFSFCIDNAALTALQGVVVEDVAVSITGTKFRTSGPLLITHWGMSGPAILRLSSCAARHLAQCGYKAQMLVDWCPSLLQEEVLRHLMQFMAKNAGKQVTTVPAAPLTHRLWLLLAGRAGIAGGKKWSEMGKRDLNRLVQALKADCYTINGRGQYKDEFVTCGGVALPALDQNTLESRQHPGVYFAGEVTDVDAVTGGFNLQAAWTMGWVAAHSIAVKFLGDK